MPLCHAWTAPGTNATIFLVKHKGPTAKEGLGLSNNWFFSSAAKPNIWKRMLFQLNQIHNFSRFPHQNHYHPHPAHCTSFDMKCSMCLKRKHFWKMQTFGKCKHKRQGNTRFTKLLQRDCSLWVFIYSSLFVILRMLSTVLKPQLPKWVPLT